LLGFNTLSAEFEDPGVFPLFGQELTRLASNPNGRALAWMSAHDKIGVGAATAPILAEGLQDAPLKAAAWDAQCYYYIPYKPRAENIDIADPDTALGVHRVKLNDTVPIDWKKFPPSVAEPVTIP